MLSKNYILIVFFVLLFLVIIFSVAGLTVREFCLKDNVLVENIAAETKNLILDHFEYQYWPQFMKEQENRVNEYI